MTHEDVKQMFFPPDHAVRAPDNFFINDSRKTHKVLFLDTDCNGWSSDAEYLIKVASMERVWVWVSGDQVNMMPESDSRVRYNEVSGDIEIIFVD